MVLSYEERLLREIEQFPEEKIAKIYKIIHILRTELIHKIGKAEIVGH